MKKNDIERTETISAPERLNVHGVLPVKEKRPEKRGRAKDLDHRILYIEVLKQRTSAEAIYCWIFTPLYTVLHTRWNVKAWRSLRADGCAESQSEGGLSEREKGLSPFLSIPGAFVTLCSKTVFDMT